MKSLKHGILAVAVVFSASAAQAGLLLEPYLGYTMGTFEDSDGKLTSPVLGARVGYSAVLLSFGVDYSMYTGGKVKDDNSDVDASGSQAFAFVGVGVPLIRAWVGYGVMNDLKLKNSGGESTYTGTAMKAGVGFTGLPFVSLNAEYIMNDYNKLKTPLGEGDTDAKGSEIRLSASLPFDL